MKDDVDLIERGGDRCAVAQIALDKFGFFVDPSRLPAAMRLRFEIIKDANFPALMHEQIGHMRPNEPGAASDKCAFFVLRHKRTQASVAATLLQFFLRRKRSQKLSRVRCNVAVLFVKKQFVTAPAKRCSIIDIVTSRKQADLK